MANRQADFILPYVLLYTTDALASFALGSTAPVSAGLVVVGFARFRSWLSNSGSHFPGRDISLTSRQLCSPRSPLAQRT